MGKVLWVLFVCCFCDYCFFESGFLIWYENIFFIVFVFRNTFFWLFHSYSFFFFFLNFGRGILDIME
jgi:hypothetical protein